MSEKFRDEDWRFNKSKPQQSDIVFLLHTVLQVRHKLYSAKKKKNQLKNNNIPKKRKHLELFTDYLLIIDLFCSVRLEQLQCDLNAVKSSCDAASVGLKTEFECNLIQDRCQGLKRADFNRICNVNNYARANRVRNNGGSPQNTITNNKPNVQGGQEGNNSAGGLFNISATLVTIGLSLLVFL